MRALYKIQTWQRDLSVSPLLSGVLRPPSTAPALTGEPTVEGLRQAAEHDPRVRALLSNTISLTTTAAGIKHNVIPARAEATLDCRLLPGVRPDDFQKELEAVIDDPKVTVERVFAGWSEASSYDTELFRAIEDAIRDHVEDAVVVPGVTVGFTDSRVFRAHGITAYGFRGSLDEPEITKTVHGHNERVSIDSHKLNCQVVWEVTRRMCTAG
ncbi:MAG: M20/M25/M40 family metallo-hydrolase [Dehalococcoidia bacterium]